MPSKLRRILFLTIDYPPIPGGMSKHSYLTALALQKTGREVEIITLGMEGSKDFDAQSGLKTIRLKRIVYPSHFDAYLRSVWVFFFHAVFYCFAHGIKIIFANTWSITGVTAYIINRITGIPYCVFAHGLDIYAAQDDLRVRKLMNKVLKNAAFVIANSHFTKGLVDNFTSEAKVVVINPIADSENLLAPKVNPKRLPGKKVILTVGRLVASKNHETIIRSLPKVINKFPETIYRIVGQGPMKVRLKHLVEELDLSGHVIFEGEAAEKELPLYYYACDIFVMVSKEIPDRGEVEGFGIVFLEAASCSKPVIASRSGGIPDAVIDGVSGILLDSCSKDEISAAIINLFSDEVLSRKLGEAGRSRTEKEFSMLKLAERLNNVLNGI